MPYIKQEQRAKWDKIVEVISKLMVEDREGELNYFITKMLTKVYFPKYADYNKAIGLLECIKQEFYRKVVGPYEDIKEKENGGV